MLGTPTPTVLKVSGLRVFGGPHNKDPTVVMVKVGAEEVGFVELLAA